ncbi:MAG: ADP-ribosylglycohydrolase family protein [Promethearchaeota archaeon]|nr:MAG: ADP-ribosylglycohydrolase family protein [Candidatus Lokiarchaeota archaeon]
MAAGATTGSVVGAIIKYSGSLARMFLQRSLDIFNTVTNREDLIEQLYSTVLVNKHPRWDSDKLPPRQKAPLDTDLPCTSPLFCEQIPLALAAFVFADGNPSDAIPLTVMIGRDCDTTATTVGSWCGALHGESELPEEWVETVCRINKPEIDIRDLVERLIAQYGGD